MAKAKGPSPARRRRGSNAQAMKREPTALDRPVATRWFLAILVLIYGAWFLLLAAGSATYAGEPIKVRARDLPLRHFDAFFRRAGGVVVFGFWALRAAAAALSRRGSPGAHGGAPLLVPLAFYAAQAAGRAVVYLLHLWGYIFDPRRWAAPHQAHPPHVMSDHILLASCAVAALACEAGMPFLDRRHEKSGRGRGVFSWAYTAAATAMALLVSAESFYTARYFHPPSEIAIGAFIGLVFFQAPLLAFSVKALAAGRPRVDPS